MHACMHGCMQACCPPTSDSHHFCCLQLDKLEDVSDEAVTLATVHCPPIRQ